MISFEPILLLRSYLVVNSLGELCLIIVDHLFFILFVYERTTYSFNRLLPILIPNLFITLVIKPNKPRIIPQLQGSDILFLRRHLNIIWQVITIRRDAVSIMV